MMKSRQVSPEDEDTTRLMTLGSLEEKDGVLTISYEDTEATGFAGSHTRVTVTDDLMVTILRSGASSSNLVLEPKKKHFCLYQTPYGTMTIGVFGKKVILEKQADTGSGFLKMIYHLDIDGNFLSENTLEMHWKPKPESSV